MLLPKNVPTQQVRTVGRTAYEAYYTYKGGKSGMQNLPTYNMLTKDERAAWDHAGNAVKSDILRRISRWLKSL